MPQLHQDRRIRPDAPPDPRAFARALRATIDAHLEPNPGRARLRELVEWTELVAHSIDECAANLTRLDEREGLVLWLRLQAFVESLLVELAGDTRDAEAAELSARVAAAARVIGAVSLVAAKKKGARS